MTFSDHPVIAEDCRKSRKFSCPYIERNIVLSEADRIQNLYEAGRVDKVKLSETISLLEDTLESVTFSVCPKLNTSACPSSNDRDESTRLVTAYECDLSTQHECPHLRVEGS